MLCPRCQHENEAGAKFCEECAAPLARMCVNCGRQLSSTAKFCPECAHPTELSAATPSVRRFGAPETYTPRHLAEKILTSRGALEGERKQAVKEGRRRLTAPKSCVIVFVQDNAFHLFGWWALASQAHPGPLWQV